MITFAIYVLALNCGSQAEIARRSGHWAGVVWHGGLAVASVVGWLGLAQMGA